MIRYMIVSVIIILLVLFLLNYTQKTHKKQQNYTPKVLTLAQKYVIMYIVKEQRAQLFDHPFYVLH